MRTKAQGGEQRHYIVRGSEDTERVTQELESQRCYSIANLVRVIDLLIMIQWLSKNYG